MQPIGLLYHQRARLPLLSGSMDQVELRGFLHLIGLIFVTTNCREIVANCLKYGWVVRWVVVGSEGAPLGHSALLIGSGSVVAAALLGYVLEARRGAAFAAAWSPVIREMQELELQLQAARTTHNIYRLKRPPSDPRRAAALSEPAATVPTDDASADEDALLSASPGEPPRGHGAAQRYIDATRNIDLSKILSGVREQLGGVQRIRLITDELNDFMSSLVRVYNNLSLRITESHVEFMHCVKTSAVCLLMLGLPYMTILSSSFAPLAALFLLMLSCTWLLKMISFFHTLHSLRRVIISDTKSLRGIVPFDDERASYLHYPYSLSFPQFLTYLFAPTLCYQFNYPRAARRDWIKIGRTCVQLFFSLVLLKIIFEQYLTKILENTFMPAKRRGDLIGYFLHFFERLLKLSIPTLYCWLLMFLSFFHYWMILLAELTRFQDQEFYRDWWNATSFSDYWRKWNLPVHHFCRRHIYQPMLGAGCSRYFAGQCVFLLSAVAHEYIIAGSLKLGWTGLVFLSFVVQTPLSIFTESRFIAKRPVLGNALFWIIFCFTGQPMGVLIFYYLWSIKSGTLDPIRADQIRSMPIYTRGEEL